ncbi:hypothetical protein DER29_2688 [Micromonospora sp. M71_S20]|uniref:hypothetical protein n=1 Tax=Micromonospora sp. M71_S20 TaxID=592872 RepID=UPI000F2104F0|nr:hypothetical protein [Micromonospora sp. M71_S20]RLK24754.1 hypothetical protein DER29_2688 [Micromonospora sp. M71_S20]
MSEDELVLAAGEPPINFRAHELRAGNLAGARDDFEQLIRELVAACHRGARLIAANPGDWGIDVVVGDLAGQIVIWQAKYFMPVVTASHQGQIRESFSSAMKAAAEHGHKVRRWTLCVPASMDAPMDKWWSTWKKKAEKDFEVKIELWHEGELRQRLISPDAANVRRHYYDPYRNPAKPKLDRPGVVQVEPEKATALETALFVRQLREAGHQQVSSAKLEFFNAELIAREIVDKDVPAEVTALVEADATVHSIWETSFNEVAELHPTGPKLPGLHASVMRQIRGMGGSWPAELRSTPVHRCGMMHRIVEDGRAGWVPHWEDVVVKHRDERPAQMPAPAQRDPDVESAGALT